MTARAVPRGPSPHFQLFTLVMTALLVMSCAYLVFGLATSCKPAAIPPEPDVIITDAGDRVRVDVESSCATVSATSLGTTYTIACVTSDEAALLATFADDGQPCVAPLGVTMCLSARAMATAIQSANAHRAEAGVSK